MPTSAEQIHQGRLGLDAKAGPGLRLFIDLDLCASGDCPRCEIRCSYFYHPDNNGIVSVAELAAYALVCRRCEEPHCVKACPADALEQRKDKDKLLIRHNMLCVSCRTCSHACPYGTIYPECVPYLVHVCDYCLDRRQTDGEPLCVSSCPHGALALRKADQELPPDTYLVGENLIVHSTHWTREKA